MCVYVCVCVCARVCARVCVCVCAVTDSSFIILLHPDFEPIEKVQEGASVSCHERENRETERERGRESQRLPCGKINISTTNSCVSNPANALKTSGLLVTSSD